VGRGGGDKNTGGLVGRRRRREWIGFPGFRRPAAKRRFETDFDTTTATKDDPNDRRRRRRRREEEERHETVPGGVFGDLELRGGTNGPWGRWILQRTRRRRRRRYGRVRVADGTESRPTRGGGTRGAPSG